ncbi:MAG: DUF2293 domain-containing protein [Candidatus Sumerlaeaceae bacterium]
MTAAVKTESGNKPERPAVFIVTNPAKCSDCAVEICAGDSLFKEGPRVLCMECADLDHLWFLPSGDAALTRRATKYSTLSAVVLKWSRSRKQYERQGILVEEQAIERAETDCQADAELRESRRRRQQQKRQLQDGEYVTQFQANILTEFPTCPPAVAGAIALHACRKYSGRVGRSAAARRFDPKAILLAVRAHVRHNFTAYDHLLARGTPRQLARCEVEEEQEKVLARWRRRS